MCGRHGALGLADAVNNVLQQLPSPGTPVHQDTGMGTSPNQYHGYSRSQGTHDRPQGLILLGETLGNNPSDPFLVGEDAFIQDCLRGHRGRCCGLT